nr:hypothetical protein [Sphingomonas sp. JXJ CY 53]
MQDLRQAAVDEQVDASAFGAGDGRDELDEVSEGHACLAGLQLGCVEGLRQLLDVAPVGVGKPGMQGDGRRDLRLLQSPVDLRALRQRRRQPGFHLGIVSDAIRHHVGQALDAAGHLGASALDLRASGDRLRTRGLAGLSVLLDEGLDEVGLQQPVTKRVQYAMLQLRGAYRPAVRAGAGRARRAAAPALGAYDRERSAADPAADQAGEQPLGRRPPHARHPLGSALHRGDDVPQRLVDDAQVRGVLPLPLGLGIGARHALPRDGIADEALAVEDDPARVELVVEDAVPALAVAAQRGDPPRAPGWTRDRVLVELAHDEGGASAFGAPLEYPADDFGLLRDDPTPTTLDDASSRHLHVGLVAVAQTARDAARGHAAHLPPARLVAEVLEEDRGHSAGEADLQFADRALRDGREAAAGEFDPLPDGRDVLLIAADAV